MFAKLRRRVGSPGVIVAVVALVFAVAGGAYAASGGLTAKQKKEVTKIAKKYAGTPGPQGAPGPAGSNGVNGKDGSAGEKGEPGADGKGIITEAETAGTNCAHGGASFHQEGSATKTYACTGATGEINTEGPLPHGKSETGVYAASDQEENLVVYAAIDFPITLEAVPTPLWPGHGEYAAKCTGSAGAPTAAAGFLCIYPSQGTIQATFDPTSAGPAYTGTEASRFGVVVRSHSPSTQAYNFGSWAVKAP